MAKKRGNNLFVWAILGLLFVGLVGFGQTSLGGNIRTVGSVGDMRITVQSYSQALSEDIRALEAQVGTRLTFAQVSAFGIDQAALGRLVATRTLDNEAAQLGLSVGDARVGEAVLGIPAFRGLDGNFDRDAYRTALDRAGMDEGEFETTLREEIARTVLQAAVVAGLSAPDAFADVLSAYVGETRTVTWARLSAEILADPVLEPNDADLQAYYEANPEAFTMPETKIISYAWLTPEMIQDQIEIDETALRDLYQSRIDEFQVPERRLVERLVFGDQAQADAAMARITDGSADFEALVAERGLDLADTDLGDVSAGQLGTAGEAVFAAGAGDVVGPLDSALGPALFRVNAVLVAKETSFEEATPELRDELAAARARRVIEDSSDGINDLLAGGAGVADLAERTDMVADQIEWTADSIDGIAAYDTFREAASAARPGDYPTLVSLADGGIFALSVDEIRPATLQPLDAVRDGVIAGWETAEIQTLVLEAAESLRVQITAQTDFAALGLAAEIEDNLTRRAFLPGTPEGFASAAFAMQPGETRVLGLPEGAVLLRLDAIHAADLDNATVTANRAAILEQAGSGIAQDIFTIYNKALQERTTVELDQSAINAVHSQFQ